jgi:penicillin amidase
LGAPVEVLRDADGVPHLFAKSERDGWFAMGYSHAQDRLWQMEFQRRVAQGRLSEFLGELSYDTDRLMRTLGIARTARCHRPQARSGYPRRAGGLCARRERVPGERSGAADRIPRVARQPDKWKPADSVSWLLVMAWDLSANWRTELGRLRYAAKLGRERAAQFIPPYPGDKEAPLPDFGRSGKTSPLPRTRCWRSRRRPSMRSARTTGW